MKNGKNIMEKVKNKIQIFSVAKRFGGHHKRLVALLLITAVLFALFPNIDVSAAFYSQTHYDNISEFQKARWRNDIQAGIFNGVEMVADEADVVSPGEIKNKTVKDNNAFFNWSDTTLPKWSGNTETVTSSGTAAYKYSDSYTDGGDNKVYAVNSNITYTVYNISTPGQFRYVLENQANGTNDIKINITSDLDFNGAAHEWETIGQTLYDQDGSIYIEGNGHTLYNLKITSGTGDNYCGLFGALGRRLIVKNLGFKSTMILAEKNGADIGLLVGHFGRSTEDTKASGYLFNVHSDGAYIQGYGKTGGLIGWTNPRANLFIENCSTRNYYVYGSDHLGGIMSYTQLGGASDVPVAVKYNAQMPDVPEAFVYLTASSDKDGKIFPVMVENTYSLDCELFSTGADSGAFISCGQSLIVRNCFTNNTIYANLNTGGFIGRSAFPADSRPCRMYDDAGERKVGNYFENCYSSGLVEGQTAMGGFTGLDNTYRGLGDISADPDNLTAGDRYLRCKRERSNLHRK